MVYLTHAYFLRTITNIEDKITTPEMNVVTLYKGENTICFNKFVIRIADFEHQIDSHFVKTAPKLKFRMRLSKYIKVPES